MENIKQHQEMGYDRSVGMFSPDGLILQVEYAEKAVKLGASTLAITTKEGIVFIGDRKIKSRLLVKDSFKKVFEIDNHLAISGSGAMSDGRRLIEQSQIIAQEHSVNFQAPIDVLHLVKDIANIQQHYSQSGGLRPFGVSLLIGGIQDNKPVLYQTTPSGMYMRFLARASGSLSDSINEGLEKDFKENLSLKEGISMGLKLFKDALKDEFDHDRFDVAVLNLDSEFNRLTSDEIRKFKV